MSGPDLDFTFKGEGRVVVAEVLLYCWYSPECGVNKPPSDATVCTVVRCCSWTLNDICACVHKDRSYIVQVLRAMIHLLYWKSETQKTCAPATTTQILHWVLCVCVFVSVLVHAQTDRSVKRGKTPCFLCTPSFLSVSKIRHKGGANTETIEWRHACTLTHLHTYSDIYMYIYIYATSLPGFI